VDSASLVPAANVCHACGKSDSKLLRCGRCRGVWFCNSECQVAAARQGHSGTNCRPAGGAPRRPSSASALSPCAAPLQPATPTDSEALEVQRRALFDSLLPCLPPVWGLCRRYRDLLDEAYRTRMTKTRVGYLAAVEKYREASTVADLIGGTEGALRRADADQSFGACLMYGGNMAAAARAVCSSLRAARASGRIPYLVKTLCTCGDVARRAPEEMVKAERESRKQERLSGPPLSYSGLDISQAGRVRLPTTPAGLSRLSLAYNEAAVATCDAALAAVGGRDSPAAADERHVPSLQLEADARGSVGHSLHKLGELERSFELLRQAVALMRRAVRTITHADDPLSTKQSLAGCLCNLGIAQNACSNGAGGEACLREALELGEEIDDVGVKHHALRHLANMSGRPDLPVGPTEAAAFRSRLNALYARAGRNPDTSFTICLESVEQPGGGSEKFDIGDGGRGFDGYTKSAVFVLECGHPFHRGCLSTWWLTQSVGACPLCKHV